MIKSQVKTLVAENMQSEQTQKTNLEADAHAHEHSGVSNLYENILSFNSSCLTIMVKHNSPDH